MPEGGVACNWGDGVVADWSEDNVHCVVTHKLQEKKNTQEPQLSLEDVTQCCSIFSLASESHPLRCYSSCERKKAHKFYNARSHSANNNKKRSYVLLFFFTLKRATGALVLSQAESR
jgi:hypothetical protein